MAEIIRGLNEYFWANGAVDNGSGGKCVADSTLISIRHLCVPPRSFTSIKIPREFKFIFSISISSISNRAFSNKGPHFFLDSFDNKIKLISCVDRGLL